MRLCGGLSFRKIAAFEGVTCTPIVNRYRRALRGSVALVAWGRVERAGMVVHVLVERAAKAFAAGRPLMKFLCEALKLPY